MTTTPIRATARTTSGPGRRAAETVTPRVRSDTTVTATPSSPSSPPHQLVDSGRRERSLDVDAVADVRARLAGGHEHHRRVHVRRFEQREPVAREVERAAAVGERLHAVGGPG